MKRVFWMILFSAEAILASSNSKSGPGVPLIEREDLRSSTDSTISTSYEDVVGVVTPLGGVAQVSFHGVKVVEVGVVLRVHQDRGVEEDGEGQVEVEREEGEVKERRSCVKME